ncbi:hypothetical protein, partial [Hornefia butyriciproducens]|uniref:hypothetical protein n=1 Tax=Hornefia butyriciproducens TaxID=2652293 RepID=UPI003F89C514
FHLWNADFRLTGMVISNGRTGDGFHSGILMILPLLDSKIDTAKRYMLREQIALREEKSIRTIYRYERQYRETQFTGLLPKTREKRRSQKLPENWDEIVDEAVQLKKEVPKRSVRQIIMILESEDYAPPGVIRQSTLQRYLYDAGMGKKALKRYTEDRKPRGCGQKPGHI